MAVCVVVRHHLPVALVVEEGAIAVVHCVVANRHQPVHDEEEEEYSESDDGDIFEEEEAPKEEVPKEEPNFLF